MSAQDVVQCVSSRLWSCPGGVAFCDRGAALVTAGETHRLPALRGSNQRAAAPATLFRPPGHPCRKESQTFGLIPFRILWIASAVGCQSTHARLRSSSRRGQPVLETTRAPGARDHKGQPAPVSTKAPGTRDHCRATGPRVCKSSLTWIHQGQPAHEFGTGHSARDHKGQPAPASTKAVAKLDHLGTTSPTIIQISPFSKEKTGLPFKACTA